MTNIDFSHLNALQHGLHREQERLKAATNAQEIALRSVWVRQLEKEVADEYAFLGIEPQPVDDLSDADILAELMGSQ